MVDLYDTSQVDLETANIKIIELKDQIEVIKKSKEKVDPDNVVKLEEKNRLYIKEITTLTTTLEEEASLANRYRIQVDNLNDLLDEVEAEKEELSVKLKAQEKEGVNMDENTKEVEELKTKIKASYTDMKELKISLQGKSDEIKVLNKHIEEYKNKLKLQTKSEDDVNMYKEKITNLNIFLDDKQKEINELNEKLNSIQDETTPIVTDESGKARIKELEGQVHNYKVQVINTENQNDEILEKESKIKSLNQQNINLQNKIDYLEKQSSEKVEAPVTTEIKDKITELEAENINLKKEIDEIKDQSIEKMVKPDTSEFEIKIKELETENIDLSAQINQIEMDQDLIIKLEKDNKQLNLDNLEKNEETTSLIRQIDNFKSQISKKDSELSELRLKVSQEKIITPEAPIIPKTSKSKVIIKTSSTVEDLKDRIVPTVRPSEIAKTQSIERGPMIPQSDTSQKPVGRVKHKSIQPSTTNLQEILDGSKLASIVYKILEDTPRIQLTFLAMRIGTSPAKCLEEMEYLIKEGFLSVKRKSSDDTNPMILLNK
jgi:chromosome segregation ATPase